eukprot:284341_1
MVLRLNAIEDPFLFTLTLPMYIIMFILQIIIFLHFSIKTYGLNISKLIKYYALTLILIALITLSLELWSIVIVHLSSTFPSHHGYCFGAIYVRMLSFILLESALFLFWVIRIRRTFENSIFALKNKFVYSMFICIPSFCFVFMIVLAIFLNPSYYSINVSSISNGYACVVAVNQHSNIPVKIILIIGQLMTLTMNICFGVLFYYKLAKFQEMTVTAAAATIDDRNDAINVLMQKHTLLASISIIVAIISYITFNILIFTASTSSESIYAFHYGFLLIDIDMFIKTITCLLMFQFYQKRFFQICFCCIKIAAIQCSCCTQHNTDDPKPMFHRLNEKAKVFRETNTTNTQSKDISYEDIHDFDTDKNNCLDIELGIGMNNIQIGEYKYLCLLVKCSVNKRIYQHSKNKKERIEDEEPIFRHIARYKNKKQPIARRKNEQRISGSFSHDISNINFYFRKSHQCDFPFVVALKCICSKKDGNILTTYIEQRITMNFNKIKGKNEFKQFRFEPLFKQIANEIKTKQFDRNVLNKSVSANSSMSVI